MSINPQRPKAGRRFHCRLCKFTAPKLGGLRAHHAKAHPTTYGSTPSNESKKARRARTRDEAPPTTTLPTIPSPNAGRGAYSAVAPQALNYCPQCGTALRRWRITS